MHRGLLLSPDDPRWEHDHSEAKRKQYADMLSLSRSNPDLAKRILDREAAIMQPLTERLVRWEPLNERAQTIAQACREYNRDGSTRRMTSCKAFVDLHLTEKGFAKLTDEEALTLRG